MMCFDSASTCILQPVLRMKEVSLKAFLRAPRGSKTHFVGILAVPNSLAYWLMSTEM